MVLFCCYLKVILKNWELSSVSFLSICQEKLPTCHCWLCKVFTHCFHWVSKICSFSIATVALQNLKTSTADLAILINSHYWKTQHFTANGGCVTCSISHRTWFHKSFPQHSRPWTIFHSWLSNILIKITEFLERKKECPENI